MTFNRTSVATGVTLAGLGALTAVAIAAGGGGDAAPSKPATAPAAEIRTETVNRTVRPPREEDRPRARPAAPRPRPVVAATLTPGARPDVRGRGRDDDRFDDHGHDDDRFDDHGGDDDSGHGRGRGRGRGRGGHDD